MCLFRAVGAGASCVPHDPPQTLHAHANAHPQTLFNAALKGVEQFLREARSLSALRHPHVVQFLGVSIEAGKYQVRVATSGLRGQLAVIPACRAHAYGMCPCGGATDGDGVPPTRQLLAASAQGRGAPPPRSTATDGRS